MECFPFSVPLAKDDETRNHRPAVRLRRMSRRSSIWRSGPGFPETANWRRFRPFVIGSKLIPRARGFRHIWPTGHGSGAGVPNSRPDEHRTAAKSPICGSIPHSKDVASGVYYCRWPRRKSSSLDMAPYGFVIRNTTLRRHASTAPTDTQTTGRSPERLSCGIARDVIIMEKKLNS